MDIDLDDIFSVPATKPAPAASKFRPNANRPVLRKGKPAPAYAKQGTSKSLEPAAAVNKAQSVAETDAHVQEEGVSQSLNSSENVRQESTLESQGPPILSDMSLDKEKDLEIPIQDPETFPGFTVVQKSVTFEEDALLIGRCSHIDKETTETEVEAEVFPGSATKKVSLIVSARRALHRGKFIPKKMKGGSKKPNSGIQHSETEKDHLPDILVDFEADLTNEGPTPSPVSKDVFNNSALMRDKSAPGDQISQPPDSETLEDCSEPRFDTSNSNHKNAKRDAAEQDSLQKPVTSSNGSAANEVRKSSRPLRKRGATLHRGSKSDVEAQNSDCIAGEANVNANGEETLSKVKKGPRRAKTTRTKGEKPTKKRKSGDCTVPEKSSEEQEPPKKKKFTHSTQRRKRVVDKVLLQTPEEDIDYQKVCMRDLILLAEHKEKLAKKAKMPKISQGSASRQKSGDGDDSHNNESTVTPEEDEALDQATDNVEPIITLFNYQSFMKKTPTAKWSKQDTELFYEGIWQFGTDLGMIKELFPDLTRHQVKLKYKKEERQNPLRLSEAIHGRAKDHRHFELVIKRLEAANKAETESNVDDDDVEEVGEEESNGEVKKNQQEEDEAASIPNFDTNEEKRETKDDEIDHANFETPQDQQDNDDDEDEIDEDFFSSYKKLKFDTFIHYLSPIVFLVLIVATNFLHLLLLSGWSQPKKKM